MASPFDRVGAALLPAEGLSALSPVRVGGDVTVVVSGPKVWISWTPGAEQIWRLLLAVPGAEFFEQKDGLWHSLGHSLPRFDLPPTSEPRRLDAVLFPSPASPEPSPAFAGPPIAIRLAPSDWIQPTRAIRADFAALLQWIERAPTAELGVRVARWGDRVMVRGERLPRLPDAERFWGNRVWLPLGFRAEPDLPETALRAASDISLGEILLLTENGAEAIPEDVFQPLTCAAARLFAHNAQAGV